MKNSEVKAIHYGAFEKLGPTFEVRKMPVIERIAPVLNLSSFIDLQNWIEAANDFQKYGKTGNLLNLTNENSSFESGLKALEGDLYTCRGKRLAKIEAVSKIRESLKAIRKKSSIPPKLSLINKIEEKITHFKQDDPINNILYSVDWCFMHGMIQQGITLGQESIITIILEQFDEYFKGYKLKDKEKRTIISSILSMSDEDFDNLNYKTNDDSIKLISNQILTNSEFLKEIRPPYSELTILRNKINHGGFTDDSTYKNFEKEFYQNYSSIIEWCNINGFVNYELINKSKLS